MKVGGRNFEFTKGEVVWRMQGVEPEVIRKYYVMVGGRAYPPKQVLDEMTGWPRTSYTTMEAQRVLARIGFASHEAGPGYYPATGGDASQLATDEPRADATQERPDRVGVLEAAIATAQEAIAGLAARVRALEAAS